MGTYYIQDSTLTNIADALREQWHTNETFTPPQMAAKINNTQVGVPINCELRVMDHVNPLTDEWERPSNWPDIEALADEIEGDQDCLYLTYDLTCHPDYHWIGFYCSLFDENKRWHADRLRYLNGEWTVTTSFNHGSGAMLRYDLTQEEDDDTIQLWRITSPDSHIKTCGFVPNTATTADNFRNNWQPCVERAGTLPWCYNWGDSNTNTASARCGATMWMEHDSAVFGKLTDVSSLGARWAHAYNLYSIDFSKWDTSNWNTTTLQNCFGTCISLKKLDLSYWNTSNWTVTNMSYLFYNCMNLEEINTSTWDTSNWAVTTLYTTWAYCVNLKQLNLNNWDTSNWVVTDLRNTWDGCSRLITLNIDEWDTSTWAVTQMNSTWNYCHSLQELHLNNWNTSGWAVTKLNGTWQMCHQLHTLEIDKWDTSNWAVDTLSATWTWCTSLKELNLNDWDTSKWVVTTLSGTWQNCTSLEVLDVEDWDTSKWTVTNMYYTWSRCMSLRELSIGDWDTSNWAVTTMNSTFDNLRSLKELDISSWDTSGWDVTNFYGTFGTDYGLQTLLTPASFGISPSATSNVSAIPPCYRLKNFSGYALYVNHSYSDYGYNLTTQSLKNILNRLPTVSVARTITLGSALLAKLTAEDIAVATNKGWTVA